MNTRKVLIAVAVVAAIVVAAVVIITQAIIPATTQATTVGTPAITSQFGDIKTKPKSATSTQTGFNFNANDDIQRVAFVSQPQIDESLAQVTFESCAALRGATGTPVKGTPAVAGTAAATAAATQAAAPAATAAANAEPDFVVMQIVAEESEACYQVGEIFLNQGNKFNLAIGITKAIAGEIAIDRANVANSRIGQIAIDISQFQSDNSMRDGRIRREWLESNKFPKAVLTDAKIVGLPAKPYQDGEVLKFQVTGMLQVRDAKRETTFDVTASLKGDTLTGTAIADFKMTDFAFNPPNIAGVLRADDDVRVVFNFTAREPQS
ncbi:MAG: YceI family protein [Anaerolineae bacterium]|nr:YceI family protein [Anaerolineae bacterium]